MQGLTLELLGCSVCCERFVSEQGWCLGSCIPDSPPEPLLLFLLSFREQLQLEVRIFIPGREGLQVLMCFCATQLVQAYQGT